MIIYLRTNRSTRVTGLELNYICSLVKRGIGAYHFVKNGGIVVHVLDGDFERAHVVELRSSIVGRENGQVGLFFTSRFIPVQHLRRPDQSGSIVDLEFQLLARRGHETVSDGTCEKRTYIYIYTYD